MCSFTSGCRVFFRPALNLSLCCPTILPCPHPRMPFKRELMACRALSSSCHGRHRKKPSLFCPRTQTLSLSLSLSLFVFLSLCLSLSLSLSPSRFVFLSALSHSIFLSLSFTVSPVILSPSLLTCITFCFHIAFQVLYTYLCVSFCRSLHSPLGLCEPPPPPPKEGMNFSCCPVYRATPQDGLDTSECSRPQLC